MNEKITIQDLIEALAEKHRMDKKDAEFFVKGIFDLVKEALTTEKYVKVKGLGTFKLIGVDSRESVDVNTGERIEIQGHNKISFTPESSLKELINKPFAHFETVILNEGVELNDIESVSAPEEEGKIEDANNLAVKETEVEPVVEVLEEPVEEVTIEEAMEESFVEDNQESAMEVVEESSSVENQESPLEIVEEVNETLVEPIEETSEVDVKEESEDEKQAEEPIKPVEPIADIPTQNIVEESVDNLEEKKEEKTSKTLIVITIILIILILAGLYWLFRPSEKVVVSTTIAEEVVAVVDTVAVTENVVEESKDSVQEAVIEKQPVIVENKVAAISDTTEYRIVGTKATYTLGDGETLIRASLKFYGSKNFWPYIAKYNQKTIKNVNNVPKGTKLLIPELELK